MTYKDPIEFVAGECIIRQGKDGFFVTYCINYQSERCLKRCHYAQMRMKELRRRDRRQYE